ncbi:hypothetical protein [Dysgonomonas macrotermitis]|uniref:Uncharacterized protein n=1 Tax=Dysgonomonas macrotermitis TaxID=1346286 RepID=A0A1M4UKW1_9BACT|nr:hypothetical protein [Dysgonomonas macrotermitis]SHE57339.1 hypothetical protein SAMN05444362_101634 [Dysgonomonas macrotermitis]
MNYLEYLEKVKAWLNADQPDIEAGAKLLLSLNRNRILYLNITRNPEKYRKKLIYELQKQAELLEAKSNYTELKSLTDEEVKELDDKVEKFDKEVAPVYLEKTKGKREDHDQLPDVAIAAFNENEDLYPKVRSTHEKLKLMANERPCDRYPFLKQLAAYDDTIRRNWDIYDTAVAAPIPDGNTAKVEELEPEKTAVTPLSAKEVTSHRAYLSRNKAKLLELKTTGNIPGYENLKNNMQTRYDLMKAAGESFDPDQEKELQDLGLTITLNEK